ncbi:Exportin-1 [Tritrichomonas musculus]|uniref:Exportin-1 n=1 Tax=Tritrichomonas musculus TaxID=1915356 RepID=A0ABR2LAE2_9EUKA
MMINNVNTYIQSQADFDFNNINNFAFTRILSMTITDFLNKFGVIIEKPENVESIQKALKWLLALTSAEDLDVLHTCCDFWLIISDKCHHEQQQRTQKDTAFITIYAPILPDIRCILIKKMQKPEVFCQDESFNFVIESLQNNKKFYDIFNNAKICFYDSDIFLISNLFFDVAFSGGSLS